MLHGTTQEEAAEKAQELSRETGQLVIEQFEDPLMIAGQHELHTAVQPSRRLIFLTGLALTALIFSY